MKKRKRKTRRCFGDDEDGSDDENWTMQNRGKGF